MFMVLVSCFMLCCLMFRVWLWVRGWLIIVNILRVFLRCSGWGVGCFRSICVVNVRNLLNRLERWYE